MSHIFDALQKSAIDDSDLEIPSSFLATDLLEAAERKTALARAAAAVIEEPSLPKEIAEMLQPAALANPAAALPATIVPPLNASVDQFSQFQTLHVLVPPQS